MRSRDHKGNLSPCGTIEGWREGGRLVFIRFHFIPLPSILLISFSGPLASQQQSPRTASRTESRCIIPVCILNVNRTHKHSLTIMDLKSHTGYLLCDDHHRPVREKNKREMWTENTDNEAPKLHTERHILTPWNLQNTFRNQRRKPGWFGRGLDNPGRPPNSICNVNQTAGFRLQAISDALMYLWPFFFRSYT